MNNPGRHQPDQEDLDRARRIMEGLKTGFSPKPGGDALLYYLDVYKKSSSLRENTSPSDNSWDQISAKMDTYNKSKGSKFFSISPSFQKIAALFLAAAVLALAYMILQPSEPLLLASSGAERSVIELTDGSAVTLRPYSSLYELDDSDTHQTYRIEGEAYFKVAENRARIFTVVSDEAKVVVTGTKFTLSNWSNRVRVYLESGSVTFSTLDGSQMVDLQPGEFSEKFDNELTEPATAIEQIYTGWLSNDLSLNSRTVSDVADEIEQHFNITLLIPDSLADERLSGSLQLLTADQVLSDLSLSLNGRFIRVDENRYRFEPSP